MNQIANVVFAYSPKNDDELELTVGDRIEVIGYEEEGWWKGRLKGKTGVFPSNFVQVVESEPAQTTQNPNKLNSLIGSLVNTKNNISSHSLNNLNGNSNNNTNLNNNNSTSNNNLMMNNTHEQQQKYEAESTTEQYPFASNTEDTSLSSTNGSFNEKRPKPLRGMGYGDIFAAGAKTKLLPADPVASRTAMASERLSTISLASTLQKSIPKKPPPPTPDASGINGSSSDQAPALPPKPSNQFNPYLQRPLSQSNQQRTVREQARVIYAYKPSADDELEMEVGDIIDVIDKNIEDQGWWRGELNKKIGVFPDNFVQLIPAQIQPIQDWSNTSGLNVSNPTSNQSNNTSNSDGFNQHSMGPADGRTKSVFAGTPKGFSKELESNLEKHSNPASFLSLKRNKINLPSISSSVINDSAVPPLSNPNVDMCAPPATTMISSTSPNSISTLDSSPKQNGHSNSAETSPGKLNHITANRAKGPTRRPPKNILDKRNQINELTNNSHNKTELTELKDDPTTSLPNFNQASTLTTTPSTQVVQDIMSSPNEQQQQQHITPSLNKAKSITTSSTPSTPPWMVELRKTNAEKKREPPPAVTAVNIIEDSPAPFSPYITTLATLPTNIPTSAPATAPTPPFAPTQVSAAVKETTSPSVSVKVAAPVSLASLAQVNSDELEAKYDNTLKQISNTLASEIKELKSDVRKLQDDFKCVRELKDTLESMKVELKTCQSATESQRRYIKDLVNNLADERKRIAAMQVEIDRNLK